MQINVTERNNVVILSGKRQHICVAKNKSCISPARTAGSENPDIPTNKTIKADISINCTEVGKYVLERAKPIIETIMETCIPLNERMCTIPRRVKSLVVSLDSKCLLPSKSADING